MRCLVPCLQMQPQALVVGNDVDALEKLLGKKNLIFLDKSNLSQFMQPHVEKGHYTTPDSLSPFGEQNYCFIKAMKGVDSTKDLDGQAQTDIYQAWAKDFTGYKAFNVKALRPHVRRESFLKLHQGKVWESRQKCVVKVQSVH